MSIILISAFLLLIFLLVKIKLDIIRYEKKKTETKCTCTADEWDGVCPEEDYQLVRSKFLSSDLKITQREKYEIPKSVEMLFLEIKK
ncbi:MAG: hypothetical protein SFU98_21675 [Leptospiraceae bacterium]|nr:hypothetical protein [Leptospiraceae bacterium]